jgi:DNA adenine methylase
MKAKPFIKWVGGKGQLIEQLESLLPVNFEKEKEVTYIEPFVGGGAMLFYMLQNFPNITHAVINDINPDLVCCYKTVRDNVEDLIPSLSEIQKRYYEFSDMELKREMYMQVRDRYNTKNLDPIENTTLFFFLNRTCFNGLYRVNKRGFFNVPCGRYLQPQICDEETLRADSKLLQKVEILCGDFEQTIEYAKGKTLFYFDPPYRPLSDTSSFNDYTKEAFNDDSQIRLKSFCDKVSQSGYQFMLSNSDCKGKNELDNFFDALYADYEIERVWASRNVNANGAKRGKIKEILVHNYLETKGRGDNTLFNIDDFKVEHK